MSIRIQLLQRYGEFKAVDKAGNDELIKGILVKVDKKAMKWKMGSGWKMFPCPWI